MDGMKSVKTKLLIPILLMFLFFVGLLVFQISSINMNLQQIKDINETSFSTLQKSQQLKLDVVQVQQWLTDISATRAADGLDDGFEKAKTHAENVRKTIKELRELNFENKEDLAVISEHFKLYYDLGIKMAQAYIDGGPSQGNLTMEEFDQSASDINNDVDKFIIRADKDVQNTINSIESSILKTVILTFISIGISFLLLVVTWSYITRGVVRPIRLLLDKLRELSSHGGDLTRQVSINSKDEIGQLANAFNHFILNIRLIITDIIDNAEQTAVSSQQLATIAEETEQISNQIALNINHVADGTTKQAAHATTILKMMEDAVSEAANGQQQVAKTLISAQQSSQDARNGEVAITNAISNLKMVKDSVSTATNSVQRLGKRSEEISGIITAISSISNQTNLLALNAAIEAARAGEFGQGFSVVAEEVRKLAEQSNQSSAHITELIKSIQTEIYDIVNLMEKNMVEIEKQVNIIEKSSQSMNHIVNQVKDTETNTQNIHIIFEALNEKSNKVLLTLEEVSNIIDRSVTAAEEVASSAEEQSSTAEEISATSTRLANTAEELQKQVKQFKV
jgi:methyl-accepting chemotaxis protein